MVKLKCTNATFPASPPEGPGCCCCLQANPLGIYRSARTLNIHASRWSLISGLLCFSLHTHNAHSQTAQWRLQQTASDTLTDCLPACSPSCEHTKGDCWCNRGGPLGGPCSRTFVGLTILKQVDVLETGYIYIYYWGCSHVGFGFFFCGSIV